MLPCGSCEKEKTVAISHYSMRRLSYFYTKVVGFYFKDTTLSTNLGFELP